MVHACKIRDILVRERFPGRRGGQSYWELRRCWLLVKNKEQYITKEGHGVKGGGEIGEPLVRMKTDDTMVPAR